MNIFIKIIRIILILSTTGIVFSQSTDEVKRMIDKYDSQMNTDRNSNSDTEESFNLNNKSDQPTKLLIRPGDITKYYQEKMKLIESDLEDLNKLLLLSDSIPPLENFGYKFFSIRDSIQYVDNSNVSDDYILGYGDEVIISVWGQAEQHVRKTLERDGTIFVENVGLLYFGGKKLSEIKSYAFDRFSKVYSTLNAKTPLTYFDISIGKTKRINITVAGHVRYAGNYVVNPSISISNILILAGGINNSGTLRNIYLQRNGIYADSLDLYPLITGEGIVKEIKMIEGDIIIVPSRGETVAINGNVINPGYYEIKNDETIATAVKFAGNKHNLINGRAMLSRIGAPNQYVLKSDFDETILINGDSLIVPFIYKSEKSISVSVSNRSIKNIPWTDNLSFEQVLNFVTVDNDNILNIELIRRNKNNKQNIFPFILEEAGSFKFFPSDHLTIHLVEKFTPSKTVFIKGEINSPGTYPLINNKESLNSIINRAGGFQETSDLNNTIIKRDTLSFGSANGELILTHGDTIIANPYIGTVKVEGAVHNPGNFEWKANIFAKNYLSYAGGLTAYGDKKHIIYITPYGEANRISTRSNEKILPGSTIRVSMKPFINQEENSLKLQQVSTIITSMVSIAILVTSTR